MSGQVFKQGRLTGALDHYFASPIAAGDKVYIVSRPGHVVVLQAGREWEILRRNRGKGGDYAPP